MHWRMLTPFSRGCRRHRQAGQFDVQSASLPTAFALPLKNRDFGIVPRQLQRRLHQPRGRVEENVPCGAALAEIGPITRLHLNAKVKN
jgi:hypothetical protein